MTTNQAIMPQTGWPELQTAAAIVVAMMISSIKAITSMVLWSQ